MKKILHLFAVEKFTKAFIDLMSDNSAYNHSFWIHGENNLPDECTYLKRENVKYYPRIDIKLNKKSTEGKLKEFDLIVYHGIFEDCVIEYFFRHKNLLRKLALYFWGGDKKNLGDWKKRIRKKYVIRNAAAIITIIPQDYIDIKREYSPKGKHFCAMYFDNEYVNFLTKIQGLPKKDVDVFNIQIGNSATKTNNHVEVLNLLKKFKTDNIRIYIPLSYGDMDYAEQVIEHGKEIFGDKLIPMQDFMPLEKYLLFINQMDVAIFDMMRQQALGNVTALMQCGCKIFLHPNGLLWDYFTKDMQCVISGVNEISGMTFEQFTEFSEEEKGKNRKQFYENFSIEKSIYEWEKVFSAFGT